jgi:hypothetical protein
MLTKKLSWCSGPRSLLPYCLVWGCCLQVSGLRLYHNNYVLKSIYVLDDNGNNAGLINPTTTYVMAAPDFVLNGGDQ